MISRNADDGVVFWLEDPSFEDFLGVEVFPRVAAIGFEIVHIIHSKNNCKTSVC